MTTDNSSRSFTRFCPAIARILMGVPLCIFGLNGFLNFIPPPPEPLPEAAANFAGALAASGYMMPLIGLTLLTVGVLLVINRFVPLALVLNKKGRIQVQVQHLLLLREFESSTQADAGKHSPKNKSWVDKARDFFS